MLLFAVLTAGSAFLGETSCSATGLVQEGGHVTDQKPVDVTALLEKAARSGRVAVIVGLKLPRPFTPEAALPDRDAVERQRAQIVATRDALLEALRGLDAKPYRTWENLPLVALKVDQRALRQLARSPHVTTIQEDGLSSAQ